MSGAPASFGNATKKAVHVKWAGKTIALGTFPSAEADEKCARAKALTRAWRSTMRPKPTRDWVMLELERLGVRVVSGRLGRKAGDEDDSDKKTQDLPRGPAPVAGGNNVGWNSNADLGTLMQRRSSSLGLSMMNDADLKRRSSLNSLGPILGLDSGDPTIPPHRPLVGGGAAAAYEAARADHYAQKREEQQLRASSLGLGAMGGSGMSGGGIPQMGLSVNPNQHYEMLKLHHMNLLNEIQETTLMMNLYQQQQLQQQQQQLQQQQQTSGDSNLGGGNDQMSMLLQQQQSSAPSVGGMDSMYGAGNGAGSGIGQRASPAMGGSSSGGAGAGTGASSSQSNDQMQAMRQQQMMPNGGSTSNEASANNTDLQKEQQELEDRLRKLKDDIAKRQIEADQLEVATQGGQKRPAGEEDNQANKRGKI